MATYCFKCPTCGMVATQSVRTEPACDHAEGPQAPRTVMVRDYRAENAGIAVAALRREREHSKDEYVSNFLPTAKDYESPSDPDGTKGLREWADTHTPAESNKRPAYPAGIPKRSW